MFDEENQKVFIIIIAAAKLYRVVLYNEEFPSIK